jgi:hypothetical protein
MLLPQLKTLTVPDSFSPKNTHAVAYTEWGAPENPNVLFCVHGLSRKATSDILLEETTKKMRIGNSNGLLAPPRRRRPPQHPPPAAPLCARLFRAAQSAATASPERPGARRSTALCGVGWCWTGTAGWGRVARRDALE